VIEVNRKILLVFVALMGLAMLSTPVFAISPQNAVKSNSPNIAFSGYSVQIFTPSGVLNEWITVDPSHVQMKTASDFYIGNAYAPSSASEILYNKWNYLSPPVLLEFLISVGIDPGVAAYVAFVLLPARTYYKAVFVG